MQHVFLYQQIAHALEQLIRKGALKTGDKMPSLRTVCREHGVSLNTAKQVYLELEKKSLIISRPQSGFFVSRTPVNRLPLPEHSKPSSRNGDKQPEALIKKVYEQMGKPHMTLFSIGVPTDALLPVAKLNKGLLRATRTLADSGTGYEPLAGNEKLRQAIARRAYTWGGKLTAADIVTTAGCMNALSYCLLTLTRPGDTIAVESPVYLGTLQLARSLGLKVLELPTHPVTGIDPDALKKVMHKISVCLLVSNFSTPLGSCMPDEHKKAVVQLMEKYNVPLIEDDLYGELYFGNSRPSSCKTYDESGLVLWCSSISKTLAPGYRVGWVAPGKFREQLLRQKLYHAISSTSITQQVTADFLDSGRYDHHLRRLRSTLHANCMHFTDTITGHFPEGTRISRPQGGLALWVELNKKISTTTLYEQAIRQQISFAPGRMFTLQEQYDHCMRLCIGLEWSERVQQQLKKLGKMVLT